MQGDDLFLLVVLRVAVGVKFERHHVWRQKIENLPREAPGRGKRLSQSH